MESELSVPHQLVGFITLWLLVSGTSWWGGSIEWEVFTNLMEAEKPNEEGAGVLIHSSSACCLWPDFLPLGPTLKSSYTPQYCTGLGTKLLTLGLFQLWCLLNKGPTPQHGMQVPPSSSSQQAEPSARPTYFVSHWWPSLPETQFSSISWSVWSNPVSLSLT